MVRKGLDCAAMATDVMAVLRFVSFLDTGELYVWRKGVLHPNAENVIKEAVEAAQPRATKHEKEEVVAHIRDRVFRERGDAEDVSWPFIGLENGVLDIRQQGKFMDFDEFGRTNPEVLVFNRLPVSYDPVARCPEYWRFLTRFQPDSEAQAIVWDHFASILDKRPRRRRALLLYGDTGRGKTTQLNVEVKFVGDQNHSAVPLHQLCGDDRFATSQIHGKLLNTWDDLADIPLKYLGQFKVLTGGATMSAQRKGKPLFEFRPYAKLHFTTNKAPPMKDVSDEAWWARWDALSCVGEIPNPHKDFIDRLTTPKELSGILNQLLKVVRCQITSGRFKVERNSLETQDAWLGQSEPARVFLTSQVFADPNEWVSHRELFRAWNIWRGKRKPAPSEITRTRFNGLVCDVLGVEENRRKGNEREKAWIGISYRGRSLGLGQHQLEGEPIEPISTTPQIMQTNNNIIEIGSKKSVQSVRVAEGLANLFGEALS